MAKVVILYGEHPTEQVAAHHAVKVAEILREKYGHQVILKEIPRRKTNYGILEATKNPTEAAARLSRLKSSFEIARIAARRYKAPAFNFHASSADACGDAEKRHPEAFRVGSKKGGFSFSSPFEISIDERSRKRHFVIEMPGVQFDLPDKIWDIRQKKREDALKAANRIKSGTRRRTAAATLKKTYHVWHMLLDRPAQQKYLHPAISEKIAAAIHERLTESK